MNFGLSHEQRMLVDTVQSFIRTELQPLEDEVEETGVLAPEKAEAIFNKSRDLGLYAMNIPEEFGGGRYHAGRGTVRPHHRHPDPARFQAFRNVYEVLLSYQDAQVERWLLPCV